MDSIDVATSLPPENRLSQTVVESIESDHPAGSPRDKSTTVEPASKKRKHPGDDAELSYIQAAMTALGKAKLSIEQAEIELQEAVKEKKRLLTILRNLGQPQD